MSQLYLDMDGVLADFDKRAGEVFGMDPVMFEYWHGEKAFWNTLYAVPDFFYTFDMMPDAPALWAATKHLHPIVLTAIPRGEWAVDQKRRWLAEKFGPDVPIITCFAKEKANYCEPGDILVDDRPKYCALWEERGGTFIVHTSAESSLVELARLGLLQTESTP